MHAIFDTHCHYNLSPLSDNWETHWQNAQNRDITQSIVVGTTLESSKQALEIANQNKHMFAAVGIHPNEVTNKTDNTPQSILTSNEKSKTNKKNIVAIGETGLDYFRMGNDSQAQKDMQKDAFVAHLQIAQEHNLPVILHVRDKHTPEEKTPGNAYWDTVEITQDYPNLQYILHCFSGPSQYVSLMVSRGAYVGVAGNITYPSARALRSILETVPKERILLETDAPYLPPQQHRGQTCEPYMIRHTGEFLESEMNVSLKKIYENTLQCFKIYTL